MHGVHTGACRNSLRRGHPPLPATGLCFLLSTHRLTQRGRLVAECFHVVRV